jgi:hypothetical protein
MTTSVSLTKTLPILDIEDPILHAADPHVADPILHIEDAPAPLRVVTVYNCSRLGRTANPPSRWYSDWFRLGRRR